MNQNDNIIRKHKPTTRTALDNILLIAVALSLILYGFFAISVITTSILSEYLGLVWSIVLGLIMGSYATTLVARMPRQLIWKQANPYCAFCNNQLQVRDLYTIFSYIINRGKCRFCNSEIPKILFYTETIVTINYVMCYAIYGFDIRNIYAASFFCCQIMLFAMWVNDRFFSFSFAFISLIIALLWYYV